MQTVNITGKPLDASVLVMLDRGKEKAALEAAKTDGADNVFFKIGDDMFVASGKGMDLKGIAPGKAFTFDNQQAEVVEVDDQIGTASEGAAAVSESEVANTIANAGWVSMILAVCMGGTGVLAPPIAIAIGVGGGVALLGATAAVGVGWVSGALKEPADLEKMKAYGTTVD